MDLVNVGPEDAAPPDRRSPRGDADPPPESGRRLLFFSGGTALRELSQHLVDRTHNSIHLVTPFDSGGSSATLREAFGMPAVGDLRNRLLALADRSVFGHPETCALLASRFHPDLDPPGSRDRLRGIIDGNDPAVLAMPQSLAGVVRRELDAFARAMPAHFDLRGASVGNLVLAGAYLRNGRRLAQALALFAHLVEARGTVRPVLEDDLHLKALLADGTEVVGQHLLTGGRIPPGGPRIRRLALVEGRRPAVEVRPHVSQEIARLIASAELICYPFGSFYTSLVAALLPEGVTRALAATDVPKVYVPNPGHDPEEGGMSLTEKVEVLLGYLERNSGTRTPVPLLLSHVLVDRRGAGIDDGEVAAVEELGLRVIDAPILEPGAGGGGVHPVVAPGPVLDILTALCG